MEIKAVGYLGLGVPDPQAWLKFGTEILGMMPARAVPGESWGMPTDPLEPPVPVASGGRGVADDGSVYLKMDERQWRVGIHLSKDSPGLRYLGLEVSGSAELQSAVLELQQHGIEVAMGSAVDANARAVTGIARFKDPAGISLELFFGPTIDNKFSSPVANLKFVAGHLGFGHLIMFVPNMVKFSDFYTRILGFKLTDYIRVGPEHSLQFLRCNERHHSIALAHVGPPGGLHHVMFEVQKMDDVGLALDRVNRARIPLLAQLGRHINDRMFSFYMQGPAGFGVEIGHGALTIDDTWTVNEFVEGDLWGHQGIAADTKKDVPLSK